MDQRIAPPLLGKGRRCVMQGNGPEPDGLAKQQDAELGIANATAFASIASNTGSSSPGELLMTCSTSEVAVCCSSASSRSRCARASFSSRSV